MGWVERLNQRALRRIRRHAIERVETDREGTTLTRADSSQFIRWPEVREIAVLKQPPLARGSFALIIRGGGSTLAVVDDTAVGYAEFCQEISRWLKGAVPYEEWAVELTASLGETGRVIFRRTGE